ncbi:MAG: hypothetical protein FWG45_04780 [Oscillospiraceae bacterium]|nr:hypothetical protein [Oscillospiraceae bacterium]
MKKAVSLLAALAMVTGMTLTAVAAPNEVKGQGFGPTAVTECGVSVKISGNGNNAVLTITDGVTTVTVPKAGGTQTIVTMFGDATVTVNVQGNALKSWDLVRPEVVVEEAEVEGEVNLGFIGHYLFDGNVLSTSFYWQTLEPGDMIDWDAVDAAYAEWVAQGGLAPTKDTWQTSGSGSYTFDDGAAIGFDDFNEEQLESYYGAFYVATGYVLPEEEVDEIGSLEADDTEEIDETDDVEEVVVTPNKGCENCQGNNAGYLCDGNGCSGNGTGAPGGDQGGKKGNGNQNQQ